MYTATEAQLARLRDLKAAIHAGDLVAVDAAYHAYAEAGLAPSSKLNLLVNDLLVPLWTRAFRIARAKAKE